MVVQRGCYRRHDGRLRDRLRPSDLLRRDLHRDRYRGYFRHGEDDFHGFKPHLAYPGPQSRQH